MYSIEKNMKFCIFGKSQFHQIQPSHNYLDIPSNYGLIFTKYPDTKNRNTRHSIYNTNNIFLTIKP